MVMPSKVNFFAYDDAWVGRGNLINELSSRVGASCRLLILVGITGIGKTALGERLAIELEDWFKKDWNNYLQENFDNEEKSSDFASVAGRLLEKCGELITPEDRKDTQRLLNRLVKHLRENRYLVQIDSVEKILEGNEEEGWSQFRDQWWMKFFQSWLNNDSCESCIILTSQDLPAQIDTEEKYKNFWYCQPLSGLEEAEQLALFAKTGLDISSEAEETRYLERIGSAYEGHPLALRVIAGEIVNRPFNKNVLAYWKKYGNEVEEVEKAIEEAKSGGATASKDDVINLHQYTRNLRRKVKVRLENTFYRLKRDVRNAYLLLCESSVYRCEVPEGFWLSHLEDWDIDEDDQQKALDTLRDRYLVEELVDEFNQCLLRQHNLIRGVSLEHLKKLGEEEEEINNLPSPETSKIDVLIITALKDELDALKNCDNDSGNSWQEHQDNLRYSYYKTTFKHSDGSDLTIAAASAVDMGETKVAELATRLTTELKPRCLAMTGVCAGNKEVVFLGDVIVADRVFKFDYGKLVVYYQEKEEQKIRTEEIFHDITTYNLKPLWKSKIFQVSQDWIHTIQLNRPKSYRHQERWFVHKLFDYQANAESNQSPQKHVERTRECPDWKTVIERLREQKLLKTESFELTEKAIKEVQDERLLYPDDERYRDASIPQVHVGVVGTSSYVQKDPEIFDRLKKLQRKALGIEMEGVAIGAVSEIHDIPMIVVKSVQDYGDHDKNDQFRLYAAETSARFLLAFLTTFSAVASKSAPINQTM